MLSIKILTLNGLAFLVLLTTMISGAERNLTWITENGQISMAAVGYPQLGKLLFYRVRIPGKKIDEYVGFFVYEGSDAVEHCHYEPRKPVKITYGFLIKNIKPGSCTKILPSTKNPTSTIHEKESMERFCSETKPTPNCRGKETLRFDNGGRLIEKLFFRYEANGQEPMTIYDGVKTVYSYDGPYLKQIQVSEYTGAKSLLNSLKLLYKNNKLVGINVNDRFTAKIKFRPKNKSIVESFDSPKSEFVVYYYE